MSKKILILFVALLIFFVIRNFTRLPQKDIPNLAIEKSIQALKNKLPTKGHIAYYSNSYDDGLYFTAQLMLSPLVVSKFGLQDSAIFLFDGSKKDSLFSLKKLPYRVIDSAQHGDVTTYLLLRNK
jgi:hypothetical protein